MSSDPRKQAVAPMSFRHPRNRLSRTIPNLALTRAGAVGECLSLLTAVPGDGFCLRLAGSSWAEADREMGGHEQVGSVHGRRGGDDGKAPIPGTRPDERTVVDLTAAVARPDGL